MKFLLHVKLNIIIYIVYLQIPQEFL